MNRDSGSRPTGRDVKQARGEARQSGAESASPESGSTPTVGQGQDMPQDTGGLTGSREPGLASRPGPSGFDPGRWVQQEEPNGCVAATLAMMLGTSYADATAMIRKQGDCYSAIARQEVLYERGWAKCSIGRKLLDGTVRDPYPPEPFAPLHVVSVKIFEGASVYHSIIWLADGTILDPMTPAPRTFADYHHIGGIDGWIDLASAIEAGTVETEGLDAKARKRDGEARRPESR